MSGGKRIKTFRQPGQSGQPVATACVAPANRELIADELAAPVGEVRGAAGKTCRAPLALAGGGAFESAAIRSNAGVDRRASGADGVEKIGWFKSTSKIRLPRGGEGGVLQARGAKGSDSSRVGAESHAAGDVPAKKGLAMSRTAKKGVQSCRFPVQKGDSGYIEKEGGL